ncbi:MAG: hypothetical protein ACXU91_03220 [Gemmatimonadaceae bacterium]
MIFPPRFLETFGPPTPPKVYDTPPLVVTSPRWPRLQRLLGLAAQGRVPDEPEANLEARTA